MIGVAPALVDAPNELGVEPDAGREREPPPVHAPERDAPRAASLERRGELLRRLERVARQSERARQHAGAPARHEPDRHRVAQAVQHLVEPAVAGEHDDGVEVAAEHRRQLGPVPRPLGAHRGHLGDPQEHIAHGRRRLVVDVAGVGVDDQRDSPHPRSLEGGEGRHAAPAPSRVPEGRVP